MAKADVCLSDAFVRTVPLCDASCALSKHQIVRANLNVRSCMRWHSSYIRKIECIYKYIYIYIYIYICLCACIKRPVVTNLPVISQLNRAPGPAYLPFKAISGDPPCNLSVFLYISSALHLSWPAKKERDPIFPFKIRRWGKFTIKCQRQRTEKKNRFVFCPANSNAKHFMCLSVNVCTTEFRWSLLVLNKSLAIFDAWHH
jgi:hypothetical protein